MVNLAYVLSKGYNKIGKEKRRCKGSSPVRWCRGNGDDEAWGVGHDRLEEAGPLPKELSHKPGASQAGPWKTSRCHNKVRDAVSEL